MRRWLISAAVVAGIIVTAAPAAAAPPEPVDVTFINSDCGFDVEIHVVGKTKTIPHGDDRFIVPAPGQKATLTATDSGKTVEYVVTGTFHVQVMPNGDQEFKVTGRNVLFRPTLPNPIPPDDPGTGIFLLRGNFTFVLDENGNEVSVFAGSGPVVNICEILAPDAA
jgi:hypothetical protein